MGGDPASSLCLLCVLFERFNLFLWRGGDTHEVGSESSLGRAVFLKTWDRGKLKTGEKLLGTVGSPGGPGQGGGGGGGCGAGQGPSKGKVGDTHPTEGDTLLLWDRPRGARCAEVPEGQFSEGKDQREDFVLPNASIIAEGVSGKGQSRLALPRLVFARAARSASSLRESRSRLGFCSILSHIRAF